MDGTAAGPGAGADAADEAASPSSLLMLPALAAGAVLHFCAQGHAKTARLVCREWRDTLDSQARAATLATWPGRATTAADGAPLPTGPSRPLHVIAPHLTLVDLTALPPDEAGGRLEALLEDLAQLTGWVLRCGG